MTTVLEKEIAKIPERVASGVAYLDEVAPKDWREKINSTNLNMISHSECVIGQLTGHYLTSTYKEPGSSELNLSRGFDGPEILKKDFQITEYFWALTLGWKKVLKTS